MPYRLRMSAELGDWLAELRSSQPAAAIPVGAALTLLLDAAELPGPPLVTGFPGPTADDPEDQLAELDHAYRRLLDSLGALRRFAATAGAVPARARLSAGRAPEPILPTAEELAAAAARERRLTAAVRHWAPVAEEFRNSKEIARGSYRSAAAVRDVQRALLADPDLADADRAAAQAALAAAEQQLSKAAAALPRLLGRAAAIRRGMTHALVDPADSAADGQLPDTAAGLLELHADPLGSDARLLFAVEPAGTVTLLAVLDSAAAVRRHRDTAIDLASQLLSEIRERGWPTSGDTAATDEVTFAGASSFLQKIFPDAVAAVRARAAELTRSRRLADLRRERGASAAELSQRSGLSEQDVAEIEFGGVRSASVADVAAYVAALGGRLVLAADLGPGGQVEVSG